MKKMPKEPYVVRIGKRGSEIHLYSMKHTYHEDFKEVSNYGHEKALKGITSDFHAIAVESPPDPGVTDRMREVLKRGLKAKKLPEDRFSRDIALLCIEKKLNIVFIEAEVSKKTKTEYVKESLKDSKKAENAKHPEAKRILSSTQEFRDLVMASNLEQAIKLHEKHYEGPIRIAFIGHEKHVLGIKKILEHPDYKQIKNEVRKITKGQHGAAKWKGLAILKPENLGAKE